MSSSKYFNVPAHGGYPSTGTIGQASGQGAGQPSTQGNPWASPASLNFSQPKLTANDVKQTPSSISATTMRIMNGGAEPVIVFEDIENGQLITATLEADVSLRPLDLMRIQVLLAAGAANALHQPLEYIRRHGLERHFRFRCA